MILNITKPSLTKPSLIFGFVLVFSAFVLSPFYLYASGLPQPGHILMFVASIAIIALNAHQCVDLAKRNKIGSVFVMLLLCINLVYALFYKDASFIVNSVYWLYGLMLFVAAIVVARDQNLAKWASRFILFKLFMVVALYLLGWGGYTFWPRYNYFFNGPNQLAYFAICSLLVFVAATRAKLSASFYIAYALTIFIVVSTGGRSAYLALLPLVILLLWLARKQIIHGIIILSITFSVNLIFEPLCLPLYIPGQHGNELSSCQTIGNTNTRNVSSYTKDRIDTLSIENQELNNNSVVVQLMARGYMRTIEYPKYLLYGAGQGKDERFGGVDGSVYEIHSSLLAVWFYYGFLGLILFLMFIWRVFDFKVNLFFLLPLFVYGLFTYGLRAPYFWLAMAFLATASDLFSTKKKADEI